MDTQFDQLVAQARSCRLCHECLPLGPRPVFQVHSAARILIAGQAPGARVHRSGIPFDDPSGDRLRHWMGIDRDTFYDATQVAILPMGFCYPGRGRSGDLPPLQRCAQQWRSQFLDRLRGLALTLVIGTYAMRWHLPALQDQRLTDIVRNWRDHTPQALPLPHPSPRNNRWLKRNPWFELEVLPFLRTRVAALLAGADVSSTGDTPPSSGR